ncbi:MULTISPECIES: hypothetical protein [Pseudomonas]|uniref:hypothetical protein n=1 Tax=Pseudomonas TaxID=286 RepID=UPI001113177B|nr:MULTISPECIES: hypothetical protein [Pseudomonas]MBM1184748.1 hypothetical protein [Pseudomonas lundensis]MEC4242416.1 hypothetical protein [Pseudomonas sp. DSV-1]
MFKTAYMAVRGRVVGLFVQRPEPMMLSEFARDRALSVLAKKGYQAHYYAPDLDVEDQELAAALRLLGRSGFIITDQGGDLVGKVSLAHSGSESRARQKRAQFRVIE